MIQRNEQSLTNALEPYNGGNRCAQKSSNVAIDALRYHALDRGNSRRLRSASQSQNPVGEPVLVGGKKQRSRQKKQDSPKKTVRLAVSGR